MSIQMGNLKVKTSTEGRNKQTKKKQNTTTHPPRKKRTKVTLLVLSYMFVVHVYK